MKNKRLIIISGLFSILVSGCHTKDNNIEKEGPVPPNIIFLLADDMRWDVMGCAGNKQIHTPNLDSLGTKGIRFNNAFVTTSVCCSSRASILTGQYVSRHGIQDFKTPLNAYAFSMTYPMLMKEAGYQVGFIGKYGIGRNVDNVAGNFDYFWGTATQPNYENTDENGNYIHYTDLVANHINEFMETTSKNKPFCLSVSFKAPHVQDGDPRQFIYNPRFKGLYIEDTIPEEPTNTLEEWEKFPSFFKKDNEARKRWEVRFSNPQQYQESVKGYYRLITGLDEVVGKVRDQLKNKDMAKNTIIIFFSDNGFYLGEHGLAGKWYGHEPSIRVPLIIYDPRQPDLAGKQISEIALNIDIAPTILAYAGIEIPDSVQGNDLGQLLVPDKTDKWRTFFYYEHLMKQFPTIPPSQGLRTQGYKYLIYPEANPVYEEIYDLKNDVKETRNLMEISGNEMLRDSLRVKFQQIQEEILNR
ncbi:sulfatase-like hydrolase/transferase [Maribellus comscasis]|uniref:Sulfatase-like hydrolase/transferase n=1 Tax=Maribellus comscasis TaxID=2681766 RepID=A0A6I6K5J3_9BACT|nr:sulfatase [Maribellus comscasis]QGY47732.1 sulfatase-like hydrolase/transferase [Maribellus comscasis]